MSPFFSPCLGFPTCNVDAPSVPFPELSEGGMGVTWVEETVGMSQSSWTSPGRTNRPCAPLAWLLFRKFVMAGGTDPLTV